MPNKTNIKYEHLNHPSEITIGKKRSYNLSKISYSNNYFLNVVLVHSESEANK